MQHAVLARLTLASLVTAASCGHPAAPDELRVLAYTNVSSRDVASVVVQLGADDILVGGSTTAKAMLTDRQGRPVRRRTTIAWTTSNPAVAVISSAGSITARDTGQVLIVASVEGVVGSAPLIVTAPAPVSDPVTTPVAGVTVQLSPDSVLVGGTASATATLRDAQGHALLGRAVLWRSADPAIASVDAGGLVRGVAAGSTRIIASSENVEGSATIRVVAPAPPPPPPPPTGMREPADFALITEREFAAKVENGWLDRGDPYFSIQTVADAPRPDDRVGQALFPAGFVAGSGPINTYYNVGGNIKRLYMGVWVKFSDNWQGQLAGVNKIIFIWIDAKPNVFLNAQGVGSGPLTPSINLQNNVGGAVRLAPNIKPGATFTRGQWHFWEVLLTANTVGQTNGTVQWWLDGEEIGRYTNVGPARDASNRWEIISWNPTWGGAGGSVLSAMTQQIDYIRVSGLP